MASEDQGYSSRKIPVPEEFGEVFSHFYVAENHSGAVIHKTLLPSFQTILAISLGTDIFFRSKQETRISIDKTLVLGPVKQPIDYSLSPGASLLVANFKSDGFYRFFGLAMISGLPVDPDELLHDDCFTHLWHLLREMRSDRERVDFILAFCRPYLKKRDPVVETLTTAKEKNSLLSPVKTAARETNQSERNMQIKQKKYLGYSAKEVSRYERFLKAIEIVRDQAVLQKRVDWFDIIHECGYFDQSQLIHDFQHFLHLSPIRFLKFQEDICMVV